MDKLDDLTMELRFKALEESGVKHLDGSIETPPPAPLRDGYETPVMTESQGEAMKLWDSGEFKGWDAIAKYGDGSFGDWYHPEEPLETEMEQFDGWDVYAFYKWIPKK